MHDNRELAKIDKTQLENGFSVPKEILILNKQRKAVSVAMKLSSSFTITERQSCTKETVWPPFLMRISRLEMKMMQL